MEERRYIEVGVAFRTFLGKKEVVDDEGPGGPGGSDGAPPKSAHRFARVLVPRQDGSARRREWRALVAARFRPGYGYEEGAAPEAAPEAVGTPPGPGVGEFDEARFPWDVAAYCALLEQLADAPDCHTLVLKLPRPYYADAYAIGVAGPEGPDSCGAAEVVPGISPETLDYVRARPWLVFQLGGCRGQGDTLGLPADCAEAGPGGQHPAGATPRNILVLDYSYE